MTSSEIKQKLKPLIEPYVQDKEAFDNLREDMDLMKDLKINSQHLVDIILDAEEEFDIEIDDESAEKMLTIQSAIEIIERLVKEKE